MKVDVIKRFISGDTRLDGETYILVIYIKLEFTFISISMY
jgi:hypothetical protein